jgi:hypothetical protein
MALSARRHALTRGRASHRHRHPPVYRHRGIDPRAAAGRQRCVRRAAGPASPSARRGVRAARGLPRRDRRRRRLRRLRLRRRGRRRGRRGATRARGAPVAGGRRDPRAHGAPTRASRCSSGAATSASTSTRPRGWWTPDTAARCSSRKRRAPCMPASSPISPSTWTRSPGPGISRRCSHGSTTTTGTCAGRGRTRPSAGTVSCCFASRRRCGRSGRRAATWRRGRRGPPARRRPSRPGAGRPVLAAVAQRERRGAARRRPRGPARRRGAP